jgi:siroheme synthase-like protein
MKKRGQSPAYYPVFLDIGGKKCVVVGGGQVALRKVRALLECGADVVVISPDLCAGLEQLAGSGEIHAINREYQEGDLEGAFVVIVATSDGEANLRVAKEARKKTALVNVVDNPENCDFIAPSYIRRGDVTIAISTSGRSPALARKIRNRLERDFGNEYASLALLINEVRTEVKEQGIKVDSDVWQEALDLDLLLELVRRGDREKAKAMLLNKLET